MNISFRSADILDKLLPVYEVYIEQDINDNMHENYLLVAEQKVGLPGDVLKHARFAFVNSAGTIASTPISFKRTETDAVISSQLLVSLNRMVDFIRGYLSTQYEIELSHPDEDTFIITAKDKI